MGAFMMKIKVRMAMRSVGATYMIRNMRRVKQALTFKSLYMMPNFEDKAKMLMTRFIDKACDRNLKLQRMKTFFDGVVKI